MEKYKLEIIAFVGGAVVMILELVGSRILAPYLGTSIIVWTSLIGIILGSLSLGYWWGGKLADRKPNYKTFSFIILISGLLIGVVALIKTPFLFFLQKNFDDLRTGSVLATLILFAPPSVTLGMISPYAIRLKMKSIAKSGETAGSIFAVSTAGSIVGTFLAGFVLIATFGSTKILYILSVILILTSLFTHRKAAKGKTTLLFLVIFTLFLANFLEPLFKPKLLVDKDTLYNRVWIYESEDPETKRPILSLVTGAKGRQSSMFLDKDDDLAIEYTKYYRLAGHFNPKLKRVLMIGGGAYSYPKDFLKKNPEGLIDVVELDPDLTALAREYFNLNESSRLTIYHQDGRIFLNKTKNVYDAILMDAFHSSLAIPYQLTTKEVVKKIYDTLSDNGVVVMNVISAIEGERGKFLRAQYHTYKRVFPQVYIFPVYDVENGYSAKNIMLVALKSSETPQFKSEDSELNEFLANLWTREVEDDLPILTDEFAPVDQYIVEILSEI
ncbi:fused MFS/spermidine synthase [Patescibacteria group bacterium]|nr:fused MFS/spermidine synthase [Patescibacteria group bacterium]